MQFYSETFFKVWNDLITKYLSKNISLQMQCLNQVQLITSIPRLIKINKYLIIY